MRRNRCGPPLPRSALMLLWSLPLIVLLLVVESGGAAASDLHPLRHGEGRLWRIERGNAPPSHIIGTIHITDSRVRDMPAPMREAFEASEQAAFEIRFTPEEREVMMAATGVERTEPISRLVDRETFGKLVALVARYGMTEEDVNRMHPFMLSYLLSYSPEEYLRQASGDLIFDLWLIQWAYDLGMRVEGLETLEEHLGVIDMVPVADHATLLRDVVGQLEADPGRYDRLVDDYLAGDMRRVFQEMEQEMAEEPAARAFKEAFLDERNRKMVERMAPLLKRGKAFVAVGAAHLPGEEGMLHLLEKQGYRVIRVY